MGGYFQLYFYVPISHSEVVKQALFKVGAGRLGNYDCCSFETLGIGQFRPLKGSNPFIGKDEEIEKVQEIKVEMLCLESVLDDALSALKRTHPYETPAFGYFEIHH